MSSIRVTYGNVGLDITDSALVEKLRQLDFEGNLDGEVTIDDFNGTTPAAQEEEFVDATCDVFFSDGFYEITEKEQKFRKLMTYCMAEGMAEFSQDPRYFAAIGLTILFGNSKPLQDHLLESHVFGDGKIVRGTLASVEWFGGRFETTEAGESVIRGAQELIPFLNEMSSRANYRATYLMCEDYSGCISTVGRQMTALLDQIERGNK